MISTIISRLVILVFGTLYPAYASYKAVRTKNVKEYVKWMMYWIVFALFTCIETFTDVFLSWFPFYYEIKIILVIWLLSPATKGSSFLYRKFVHPLLSSREQEIDEYLSKAKEKSYQQVLDLGSKGMSVLMQSAIKTINQTLPVGVKQSVSNPALSSSSFSSDEADSVRRTVTAPSLNPDHLDEVEMILNAEIAPKCKAKVVKRGRGRSATRKSNRKTVKTETEYSD
ncbi:unnamed protein product [Brassicogethes aeneus]|uniref:Receptor expression-enhancing protein n=1 Tax=Brassicogethes aeneus TaxID=1431903 RepID=A0A9P0B2P2_BRAAE|nr:unnamed protein product [Brassicogethes aeneus]